MIGYMIGMTLMGTVLAAAWDRRGLTGWNLLPDVLILGGLTLFWPLSLLLFLFLVVRAWADSAKWRSP